MMRRFARRHTGMTARRMAVRPHPPWYGRLMTALILFLAGYAIGYWQFGNTQAEASLEQLHSENTSLQQTIVHMEQQSQVDRAAQRNLASQMATLQEENMRLKEDVVFYDSILSDSNSKDEPRIHSVKLVRGARSGEYRYQILLMQSGRHDKPVQGALRLLLQASQEGKAVSQPLNVTGQAQDGRISFKYYQRVEGAFVVPQTLVGQSVQVEFVPTGARQQKLVKSVNFPG